MSISKEIRKILQREGVNFAATYPCAKFQSLYNQIHNSFYTIGLTKEEEGVGLCAGASLVGSKPVMLIQSTGLGNMVNALCSLTLTYKLPLVILASWRGRFEEKISAQLRLGQSIPPLLKAINIKSYIIEKRKDLPLIPTAIQEAYSSDNLQVVLLSPLLWDEYSSQMDVFPTAGPRTITKVRDFPSISASLTRYEIIKASLPFLKDKVVICNIGFPSRELYQLGHQSTNFYMLGSLGLASSIGLGIAACSSRNVVVIDGDGSLLANLGSLATIAQVSPQNLTILAIDNGVHGSTGNQPTATSSCADLALTASGLGFQRVYRAASLDQLGGVYENLSLGPNFVHIPALPGNTDVPIIPLSPIAIKNQFMKAVISP
ncbi:MAG: sulfopyruvate decarboxylase subunit alpha [Promethearchaeota archaeon]